MVRRGTAFPTLLVACALFTACGTNAPEDATAPRSSTVQTDAGGDAGGSPRGARDSLPSPADPAPEFEVQTFDGETFALAEQRGTPVVLNFWESW